ncbi:hypothetical protein [Aliarcobacter cibarius]|jgi:hypothetical protein|uniref:Uncharacterized protein n=1 Tax=Aliarcobacter cibarius TaxID=255507 RepID=A0ABY2V651_9BACT|nr:hypothetical protein [Aliarcobacter cibarius]QEZ88667.1 putative membrane protein [Aliarcobacter cibarius]TLS98283.1 hypothetical protein FE247_07395 [Aliarcobacter cibarius]TLS98876.1 hypothetical protein FE245_07490 [Aliarcobacter cibarius]TLT03177.1 hypothetical protein FE248_07875 [Aliarcobacter cibarius]
MGLKNYIIASILLIILVFGFTHSLEFGEYTFSMFDYSLTLPIAIWVVMPLALLAFVTYLHIIFYGLVKYFKLKALDYDMDALFSLIESKLLEKENKSNFRTKRFKELSNVLNQLEIKPSREIFSSSNEELNKIVSSIQSIKDGKYVSEKSIKIQENSTLGKQNLLNKINEQVDFALDVVKKSENYDFDTVKQAFLKVLSEKSMTTIKKVYKNVNFDKELVSKLFEKDRENSEFGFENSEIIDIVKNVKLTKDDYLEMAKNYKSTLNPDKIIDLFEKLSNQNEEATTAYLFVLSEFEMIDKLREVLANTNENEYVSFKALVDLKDCGKHYNLESLSYK